jgi:putative ABC transport system permease protein
VEGSQQTVTVDLEIQQIVPPSAYQRRAIFADLPLLEAVEDYRDAIRVPAYDWPGLTDPPAERVYASFRLYAADLDAVQVLSDLLSGEGIDLRSNAADIQTVEALDRNLTQIFAIIAGLGGLGYLLSLGANLWSNVERKYRDLSVLRLLGVSGAGLVRFPIFQAIAIALVGSALAFAVYLLAQATINALFSAPVVPGEAVCLLLPGHYAVALAMTVAAAALASAVAGWQASRVEPAEGMRSV